MSITWVLCLAQLLIIPVNMIIAGYYRQKFCSKIGAKFGYVSELALSSQQAWDYAQHACPMRYMITGLGLIIFALLMMRLAWDANKLSISIFSVVILLIELLIWSVVYVSVEYGLRKLLGIKEE